MHLLESRVEHDRLSFGTDSLRPRRWILAGAPRKQLRQTRRDGHLVTIKRVRRFVNLTARNKWRNAAEVSFCPVVEPVLGQFELACDPYSCFANASGIVTRNVTFRRELDERVVRLPYARAHPRRDRLRRRP